MWENIKTFVAQFPATLISGGGAALVGGFLGAKIGGLFGGIVGAVLGGGAGAAVGFYKEHYLPAIQTTEKALKPKASSHVVASEPLVSPEKNPTQRSFVITPDDQMLAAGQDFFRERLLAIKNSPSVSTTQKISAAITLAPLVTSIPKLGKEVQARLTGTVAEQAGSPVLKVEDIEFQSDNSLVGAALKDQKHDLTTMNLTLPLIKTKTGYQLPLDHPDAIVAINKITEAIEAKNLAGSNFDDTTKSNVTDLRKMLLPKITGHLVESSAAQYGPEGASRMLDYQFDTFLDKYSKDKETDGKRAALFKEVILEKYRDGSLAAEPEKFAPSLYTVLEKAESERGLAKKEPENKDGVILIDLSAPDMKSFAAYTLEPVHKQIIKGLSQYEKQADGDKPKSADMQRALEDFKQAQDTPLESGSNARLPAQKTESSLAVPGNR